MLSITDILLKMNVYLAQTHQATEYVNKIQRLLILLTI